MESERKILTNLRHLSPRKSKFEAQNNHSSLFKGNRDCVLQIRSKVKYRFQAVYEVIPQVNGSITAELLKRDLGDGVKVEQNESGTFHLTFNGVVDIHSGNDVHLEIKSEQLESASNQQPCLGYRE